jgi:hypothetical protein
VYWHTCNLCLSKRERNWWNLLRRIVFSISRVSCWCCRPLWTLAVTGAMSLKYYIMFEGMNVCSVLFLDLFISTLLGTCTSVFAPSYLSSTMSWLLRYVFLVFPCGCGYCLIFLSELKTFPELREMFLGKVAKSWNMLFYVLLFCGYCLASQLKYLFYIADFLKMSHWRTQLFASYITYH